MREAAEPARSAVAGTDLAVSIDRLSWLCPGLAALTAIARPFTADTWPVIRKDPGAVLLLLCQPGANLADRLDSPSLIEEVLRNLDGTTINWNEPVARQIRQYGLVCAAIAERISRTLGRVDSEAAWITGLFAPLGWYTVYALDPVATLNCLSDADFATNPAATQRRYWGVDAEALARRFARRLNMPGWLTAVLGHLPLSAEASVDLGADADLLHVIRLAFALTRERQLDLGSHGIDVNAEATALGVDAEDLKKIVPPLPDADWQDPRQAPLLRDILTFADENRRLRRGILQRRIDAEADRLHDALQRQTERAAEQLRTATLGAMAEFAAGAGHEINNPLAVISGQAQYLLGHASKWFTIDAGDGPRKSLQAIVTQTKRIHNLLRDLLQFSRPSTPRPSRWNLAELLPEAAAAVSDLAEQRHVRLEIRAGMEQVRVQADREQVKTVLINVLRNSVEAAPAEGWARVSLGIPAAGRVEALIEDSGPGLDEIQRKHLFDPFYSGRSAGRGRGLGLPTAWRLARLQGGDVRFDATQCGEPTRFVVELPWSAELELEPIVPAPIFTESGVLNGLTVNG